MNNYDKGALGEKMLMILLEQQVIPNLSYIEMPNINNVKSNIHPVKINTFNRHHGDVRYITGSEYCDKHYVDAKNGDWVSVDSLDHIKDGAIIFFNLWPMDAVNEGGDCRPFAIRIDRDVRRVIRDEFSTETRVSGQDGYKIMWNKMKGMYPEIFLKLDEDAIIRMRNEKMLEFNKHCL